MLTSALHWLENEIAVIPVGWKSKRPLVEWSKYQSELPFVTTVTEWFSRKRRNLAIITGWQQLVVLDFDNMDAYKKWYAWAVTENTAGMIALYTLRVLTSRGVHVYVRVLDEPICTFRFNGGDVKASGGYVLVPPSVHPNGTLYRYTDPQAPILAVSRLQDILAEKPITPPGNTAQYSERAASPWQAVNRKTWIDDSGGLINRIREQMSILELIPDAVQSRRNGFYMAQCPFHNDKHPSFWIDTNREICGCFSCQMKPMDVVNLYARLNNVSNQDAIFQLGATIA